MIASTGENVNRHRTMKLPLKESAPSDERHPPETASSMPSVVFRCEYIGTLVNSVRNFLGALGARENLLQNVAHPVADNGHNRKR